MLLRIHPDATRLTNLGRTTLYAAIAVGELRAVKFGRPQSEATTLKACKLPKLRQATSEDRVSMDPRKRGSPIVVRIAERSRKLKSGIYWIASSIARAIIEAAVRRLLGMD